MTLRKNMTPAAAAKAAKQTHGLYQMGRVFDTLRLDRQNKLVRRLVRKHQDGTLGEDSDVSDNEDEEDDTQVIIGDVTIGGPSPSSQEEVHKALQALSKNQHAPLGPTNTVPAPETPRQQAAFSAPPTPADAVAITGRSQSAWPLWRKALLLAALGLGSAGTGIGGLALYNSLTAPTPTTDTDTDTRYMLDFCGDDIEQIQPPRSP